MFEQVWNLQPHVGGWLISLCLQCVAPVPSVVQDLISNSAQVLVRFCWLIPMPLIVVTINTPIPWSYHTCRSSIKPWLCGVYNMNGGWKCTHPKRLVSTAPLPSGHLGLLLIASLKGGRWLLTLKAWGWDKVASSIVQDPIIISREIRMAGEMVMQYQAMGIPLNSVFWKRPMIFRFHMTLAPHPLHLDLQERQVLGKWTIPHWIDELLIETAICVMGVAQLAMVDI